MKLEYLTKALANYRKKYGKQGTDPVKIEDLQEILFMAKNLEDMDHSKIPKESKEEINGHVVKGIW